MISSYLGEHKIIFFFRQNILGRKSVQTDLFSRCTGNQKILGFFTNFQHCSDIRSNCWMLVFFSGHNLSCSVLISVFYYFFPGFD